MEIITPTPADWPHFRRWADLEGWRVPPQELDLLQGALADSAFVLRDRQTPLGFVTAVAHEGSGWIGNLIVPAGHRGRGWGRRLFEHALRSLADRDVGSVWLTASAMGRPLYEQLGFRAVDGIVRWVLNRPPDTGTPPAAAAAELLFEQDRQAWGGSRRGLLAQLARHGRIAAVGETVALAQDGAEQRIIGPWLSSGGCPRENRLLLQAILALTPAPREWATDVVESSPVQTLLAAAGFERAGRTDLMVRGRNGADLSRVVALASLGSLG